MKMLLTVLVVVLVFAVTFAVISSPNRGRVAVTAAAETEGHLVYFAGGCFWGIEHMMAMVPGVINARSGYANGTMENPDYRTVTGGDTGHRETVEVSFDPSLVTLEELVGLFFSSIDPTVQNRQGNDVGTQYQTGIYFVSEADGQIVRALAEAEKASHPAFHVEIGPLTAFWEAEDYHQDYLIKNPYGYCHITGEDFERAKNTGKQPAPKTAEYRAITPKDAKAAMDAGQEIILVDVREPYEFDSGHIPGAINLPLGNLTALAATELPDKDALIYLYCRSGARSRTGAMQMVKLGYTNLYDLGGIINWPYEIE